MTTKIRFTLGAPFAPSLLGNLKAQAELIGLTVSEVDIAQIEAQIASGKATLIGRKSRRKSAFEVRVGDRSIVVMFNNWKQRITALLPSGSYWNSRTTLFLDFDGVLHGHAVTVAGKGADRHPEIEPPGRLFEWANKLEQIVEQHPEIEIVLSTRWVWWFGFDYCRACLPTILSQRVVGATWEGSECMPEGWIHLSRKDQILLHVQRYGITDWVAIDDDGTDVAEIDLASFIICDPSMGISDAIVSNRLNTVLKQVRAATKQRISIKHSIEMQKNVERSLIKKTAKYLKNDGSRLMDYIRKASGSDIPVDVIAEYLHGSEELPMLLGGDPVEDVAKRFLQTFFGVYA